MGDVDITSYSVLAHEYYDAGRHPTCANFRELSLAYFRRAVAAPVANLDSRKTDLLVEVGCGQALAPQVLDIHRFKRVVLTDSAPEMLSHSVQWRRAGAELVMLDARRLHEAFDSIDLLLASLGDPYNGPSFWRSVHRVMSREGIVLFTMPAFEWAHQYRSQESSPRHVATFSSIDGTTHYMPSFIPNLSSQVRMMSDAGLTLLNFDALTLEQLSPGARVSPKLGQVRSAPVLWGFTLQKLFG